MKTKLLAIAAASLLTMTASPGAQAFDATAVLRDITAARASATVSPPGGMAMMVDPTKAQLARLEKEESAAFTLMSTCQGRFGSLQKTLERQVSRAEWISAIGGVIGVIGAVATCPHCAAGAAGLAGLANPLQQTFRANSDTPQDTRAQLNLLAQKIQGEIERYTKLPPAIPGDLAFEPNMRARLDALFMTTASCTFYQYTSAGQTDGTDKTDNGADKK